MSSDDSWLVALLNDQLAETISERDALKVRYDSKNQEDAILGARIASLDAECKRNRAHIVAQVALEAETAKYDELSMALEKKSKVLLPEQVSILNSRLNDIHEIISVLEARRNKFLTSNTGTLYCVYYLLVYIRYTIDSSCSYHRIHLCCSFTGVVAKDKSAGMFDMPSK
jgi:hypothetical protein